MRKYAVFPGAEEKKVTIDDRIKILEGEIADAERFGHVAELENLRRTYNQLVEIAKSNK